MAVGRKILVPIGAPPRTWEKSSSPIGTGMGTGWDSIPEQGWGRGQGKILPVPIPTSSFLFGEKNLSLSLFIIKIIYKSSIYEYKINVR